MVYLTLDSVLPLPNPSDVFPVSCCTCSFVSQPALRAGPCLKYPWISLVYWIEDLAHKRHSITAEWINIVVQWLSRVLLFATPGVIANEWLQICGCKQNDSTIPVIPKAKYHHPAYFTFSRYLNFMCGPIWSHHPPMSFSATFPIINLIQPHRLPFCSSGSLTWPYLSASHCKAWCGLQYTRLPCPSLSPGVCSNSCPLSWWCHPIISSSVIPFSSCFQSFPASGFPMSWLFASGGQSYWNFSISPSNDQLEAPKPFLASNSEALPPASNWL